MIARSESNMPTTSCMKPSDNTEPRVNRQIIGGMNYARHGNAAGTKTTDGGTRMDIVGIPTGIGTTMIITPTTTEEADRQVTFHTALPLLTPPAPRTVPGKTP